MDTTATGLSRFIDTMEYRPVDRAPNYEVGVWPQTRERWLTEGLAPHSLHWDWWTGEEALAMDAREFLPLNLSMMPRFEYRMIEATDRYEVFQDESGVVRKALIEGTTGGGRACMDQYLSFPVTDQRSFNAMKKRYDPRLAARYPAQWRELLLPRWQTRTHPLVLGPNCSTLGFYWQARAWMGTEGVCYGWYDDPALMQDMTAFWGDFLIEALRPIVEETDTDYVMINEDMSMKNGPLLSPATYKAFIYPHMRRLVDFLKGHGVRYVMVDTDGNCEALVPLLMDAGVDAIWPLERAADMDPIRLRKKFGRGLRLFGGVDKRELARDRAAIDAHLKSLAPLVEEGGFIPTVDHTVPPDVSWENFQYYMARKADLLAGRL